jgi:hypothetical protein
VTGYFEVINASAPHIYHSALVLAPQESIVRKLYQSHTHPLTRIVHGAPISWDPHIAATTFPSDISLVVWSPCSRFLAVTLLNTQMVVVLDSVTLQKLQTLKFPQDRTIRILIFSPDSYVLTCIDDCDEHQNFRSTTLEQYVISWDLQTGGVTSTIRWQKPHSDRIKPPSITYSANGKLVGIFYWHEGYVNTSSVIVCDVASGIYVDSYSLNGSIPLSNNIWTHGESLRFATADATAITIWEVGFISGGTPTEVETFPAPDNIGPTIFSVGSLYPQFTSSPNNIWPSIQFLPTSFLLSLTFMDRVLVWDVQNSRCLLDCPDIGSNPKTTFSSDGCFFACTTFNNIYLWKKSPTGYIPHGMLVSGTGNLSKPLFSQNGESIAVFYNHTIWFWHRNSFTTRHSSLLTQTLQGPGGFIVEFSPDRLLAVVAREKSSTAMILNLKSGVPQLTISVDILVYGLGLTENTVVVIGNHKVIAWDLPAEGYIPDARVGLEDSSWTTNLEDMAVILGDSQGKWKQVEGSIIGASISPDSSLIALTASGILTVRNTTYIPNHLCIYSASTGECLGHEYTYTWYTPRFSPDGCNIWCRSIDYSEVVVWRVGGEDVLKCLGHAVDPENPPKGYPWGSSCDYQVTDDWWILGPDRKRLLMLPPLWRSNMVQHVWKGQFLALLHEGLLEPVILEVEP